MNKEKILSDLERDSFNGQITIDEFRKRVKKYAEIYHTEQCNLADVVGRSEQLKMLEHIRHIKGLPLDVQKTIDRMYLSHL